MEVFEALQPWLKHATYISLSHAGEPTLSPIFRPLLEYLGKESPHTKVHVMTNGFTLDEASFLWAVRHGVRAMILSIDGLSSETHDWLRVGSCIRELEKTITTLAHSRQVHRLPVRLGISWTVNRRNLPEVYQLPERAQAWGIDVVKLEELVLTGPETSTLGPVADSQLAQVVEFFRERCQALNLVFVDHTQPRGLRRCQRFGSEANAEFIAADDYINVDTIHLCRAPYDTVFVEADGTVKPISFHHLGAGNLLQVPLPVLFNSEHFQAWRERTLASRRCQRTLPCSDDTCESI